MLLAQTRNIRIQNEGGFTFAQISHAVPPALRAHLTFRAMIAPGMNHPPVTMGALKDSEGGASRLATINSYQGSAYFQYSDFQPNGSSSYPSTVLGLMTEGVWQRFDILLVVTPPAATATVRMNNAIIVNQMALLGSWPNGMAFFDLGCSANLPVTAESVRIDDVTFDTK